MTETTIHSLEELRRVAREVLQMTVFKECAQVIALSGDLGAGKTAFVKELATHLGIPETITSPTFVIMKSYQVLNHPPLKTLTHIDAYRIESDEEMRVLGFLDMIQDCGRLLCIEWPEKIPNLIPSHALKVHIALNADGTRTISYGK